MTWMNDDLQRLKYKLSSIQHSNFSEANEFKHFQGESFFSAQQPW